MFPVGLNLLEVKTLCLKDSGDIPIRVAVIADAMIAEDPEVIGAVHL